MEKEKEKEKRGGKRITASVRVQAPSRKVFEGKEVSREGGGGKGRQFPLPDGIAACQPSMRGRKNRKEEEGSKGRKKSQILSTMNAMPYYTKTSQAEGWERRKKGRKLKHPVQARVPTFTISFS